MSTSSIQNSSLESCTSDGENGDTRNAHMLSRGASTPIQGHDNQPFASPLNLSHVSFDILNKDKFRKTNKLTKGLQEVPKRKSRAVARKSGIDHLRSIVANRLSVRSASKSLSKSGVKGRYLDSGNGETSSEDEQPVKKKIKYVHKGVDWKQFKAKHMNGIYADILNKPREVAYIAEAWIQLYKKDHLQAITALLQFIIDICGYQELDVTSIFNYDVGNHSDVIDYMQKHPPNELKKSGRYLMKTSTDWGNQIQQAIFRYFEKILLLSHTSNILNDYEILKVIIPFLFCLTLSNIRPLKHTGVVIVAKMYSTLLKIEKATESNEGYYSMNRDINSKMKYLKMLERICQQFQKIIVTNCCLNDPQLDKMKITCLQEMCEWFNTNPSLLISSKLFHRLMCLVQDWSKAVRLAALNTCYKLVQSDQYAPHIAVLKENFMKTVGGRIYDCDYTVASTAIQIHERIAIIFPEAVTIEIRNVIVLFLFGQNLQLAKASGEFLMMLLKKYEENQFDDFIKKIIKFCQTSKDKMDIVLIIEALIHCCPHLKEWNSMINLLLSHELNSRDEATLVDITCTAAYIVIAGRAKLGRTMYSKSLPKAINARSASQAYLSGIHLLLRKFSNDPILMVKLTDVLLVIDITDDFVSSRRMEIINALNTLRSSFVKMDQLELLENISKINSNFSDESCSIHHIASEIIKTLKRAVSDAAKACFEDIKKDNEISDSEASMIYDCVKKLSILFANHDLTDLIDYNTLFNELLDVEQINLNVKLVRYLISSAYYYLIWTLQHLLNGQYKTDEELQDEISTLNDLCGKFQKTCLYYMNKSDVYEVCQEAFQRICNMHYTIKIKIEDALKSSPYLEQLILSLSEDESSQIINFAEKLIFINTDDTTLKNRRIFLGDIINLAFLNVIDYKFYAQLFQYYHVYDDLYGDIFKNAFNNMRAESPLLLVTVMLETLIYYYNLFIKDNSVTVKSFESATEFRTLVKEYQLFICRYMEEVKLILYIGVNWAISSKDSYGFLYFLKNFTSTISWAEKQSILNSLNSNLTSQNKENVFIVGFIKCLKKASKTQDEEKSLNSTSTSVTTTSFNIEEFTESEDFATE